MSQVHYLEWVTLQKEHSVEQNSTNKEYSEHMKWHKAAINQ